MSDSESSVVNPLDTLAEEFVARHRRGENPSVSEYAAKYPELADDIRDLFPGLLLIEDMRPEAGESTGPFTPIAARSGLKRLGDYRILREIGHGGMGVVYEAEQVSLDRHVALKVLPAAGLMNPTFLERFRREAKAAARLHYTNIVPVFGVGETGDSHFYAMQFIQGQSLDQVLSDVRRLRKHSGFEAGMDGQPLTIPESSVAQGLLTGRFEMPPAVGLDKSESRTTTAQPPTPAEAKSASGLSAGGSEAQYFHSVARVGLQAAGALAYAHRQGIVHRDIKPSNLLLDKQGTVWITDFGLAKAEGADELTQTGDIVGTVRFMAPERFDGQSLPQSDIYSLGLTLYEMLTLRPAFHDTNRERLIKKVLHEPAVPPRKLDSHIPRDMETIVLKCLCKDAADRYATAEDLGEDLQRFLADQTILARRTGPVEHLRRWCRHNPALAAACGLAASLLVAVTTLSLGWGVHARHTSLRMQEQLAERHFDLALADCQRGEVGLGMLGLARGLETAPKGATDLCRTLRASLAAWQSKLLPLTDCRPATGKVVAFDPDGLSVWVADGSAACRRLISTGETVSAPLPHDSEVKAVATCQDGPVVLTLAGENVRLWDSVTGKVGQRISPPGVIQAVALSPDGRTVFTAIWPPDPLKPTIQSWDAQTGEKLARSYPYQITKFPALAVSPDGRTLLATQDGAICSWEVKTGKSLGPLPIHRGLYSALAYAPNGRLLLTGSRNNTVQLWDINTGRPQAPTLYHGRPLQSVAWSRDGRSFFTADTSPTIRTWAVEEGPLPARRFPHANPPRAIAISPDGRTIATGTTGNHAGTVSLWSKAEGTLLQEMPHNVGVAVVLFSPDGLSLVTADWWLSRRSSVRFWDCASGTQKGAPLRKGKWAHAMAFTPDGRLLVAGTYDGTIEIWDAASGASRGELPLGPPVLALALDSQGKRMVTGSSDGIARVWDLDPLRLRGECQPHGKGIRAVAFSPQGDRVLTASEDGSARLWDAATCQPLGRPLEHGGSVWVATFSPDGRRILTGSLDGTGRLWDAATGEPVGKPLAHDDEVRAVAFSPDGHWMATASWDGTARLWDAVTGRPLGPPLRHAGKVWAIAFDPQSQMLLTGAEDRQARLWRIPDPLEGSVERVVLWAQVLTGMELDAGGGIHVLDPQSWQQRRQQLDLRN
jgi:WD40 repeat protein/serine/threonine protein kinase